MKVFYSKAHAQHNPPFEVFDGGVQQPYLENPERMEHILSALQRHDWVELNPPEDFGLGPILAIHDAEYVDFLRTAFKQWIQEPTNYTKDVLLPATFPARGWLHKPSTILGMAGYYMADLSAPIVDGTYQAALISAHCALSAAKTVLEGERVAFAMCRPPGHHAGKANCGGYCYFNNAAIAANWLSAFGNVAVLDIDYHAGNGTQDIFYERDDILTISIHADPAHEYPYFSGYADETGAGTGSGTHRNFPIPAGADDADYLPVLREALRLIQSFRPASLVVPAGLDLYEGDPLGTFKVTRDGIGKIAAQIAGLRLPTVLVMEGGYNNAALGKNVLALLQSFSK